LGRPISGGSIRRGIREGSIEKKKHPRLGSLGGSSSEKGEEIGAFGRVPRVSTYLIDAGRTKAMAWEKRFPKFITVRTSKRKKSLMLGIVPRIQEKGLSSAGERTEYKFQK